MAKWKIIANYGHTSTLITTRTPRSPSIYDGISGQRQLRVFGIVSIENIEWADIPDNVKDTNIYGYKFIHIADPQVTIDDFEIEIVYV